MQEHRWYDTDPATSLAISLLRNSSEELQEKCAAFIIDYAKQNGVTLKNSLSDAFNFILRRWYDQNKVLSEAFAYFEQASAELQKEIALEVIKRLQLA